MPIYEFYCADCHRVFNFLSRTPDVRARPSCPRCGRPDLERRVSRFAVSKGSAAPPADDPGPGMDDARMERAMAELAHEAEGLREDDPRQMAGLMRKLFARTGLPVGEGMEEAMRRMEAGEDPEAIEDAMGNALDGEEDDPDEGREAQRRSVARGRLPPPVDPELYEL
jgi:putative FmdB family regulatory protein